jgi:hypothetical protein
MVQFAVGAYKKAHFHHAETGIRPDNLKYNTQNRHF